jgi:hypothetical protein
MDNRKSIKVDVDVYQKLKDYADNHYMKINGLIEMLIDEKIKNVND